MSTLEDQMLEALQASVIKQIHQGDWLSSVRYQDKLPITQAHLRAIYERIDWTRVEALVLDGLEQKIADKILHSMATEVATDVKQIMSNTELREDLRATLRTKMREGIKGASK